MKFEENFDSNEFWKSFMVSVSEFLGSKSREFSIISLLYIEDLAFWEDIFIKAACEASSWIVPIQ